MSDENVVSPASTSATVVHSFSRSCTATEHIWNLTSPPFSRSEQLCKELYCNKDTEKSLFLRSYAPTQTLPDAPRIRLECPSQIMQHCLEDLDTPLMNKLGDKLWNVSPTPEVPPLSQHQVLDRRIQVTEDPSVHLLWTEGIIYVKPLPAYLTSFAFWEYLLDTSNDAITSEERDRLKATALGFMRSYASLVQRRSDFNIAVRHDLLGSFTDVSFEQFIAFISSFDSVPDLLITSRWRCGVIKLDALNFHSAFRLRRWHLNRYESRFGAFFQQFFPIALFIWAFFSVILNSMQVILNARQFSGTDNAGLNRTLGVFVWFSCEAIGWALGFGIIYVVLYFAIVIAEVCKRKKAQRRAKKKLKAERASCP